MHEKYRQKMICRESVNVVGNETLLQQAVTVRKYDYMVRTDMEFGAVSAGECKTL